MNSTASRATAMSKITRKQQRENSLDGKARCPHTHSRSLRLSLAEASFSSPSTDHGGDGVCPQMFSSTFSLLSKRWCTLELSSRRERRNPASKRPESEFTHYRDITRQNEWLRPNMSDSLGNYLYCFNCILEFQRHAFLSTQY